MFSIRPCCQGNGSLVSNGLYLFCVCFESPSPCNITFMKRVAAFFFCITRTNGIIVVIGLFVLQQPHPIESCHQHFYKTTQKGDSLSVCNCPTIYVTIVINNVIANRNYLCRHVFFSKNTLFSF